MHSLCSKGKGLLKEIVIHASTQQRQGGRDGAMCWPESWMQSYQKLWLNCYVTIALRGSLSLFSTLLLTCPDLARWRLIWWVVLAGAEQQANAAGGITTYVDNAARFTAHVAMRLRAQGSYPVPPCPAGATALFILSGVVGMTAPLALLRQSKDGRWSCSLHGGALWVGFGLWLVADFFQWQISILIPISRANSILHSQPLVLSDFGPAHKLAGK